MAISFRNSDGAFTDGLKEVAKLLKTWYKDGVVNLLFRNSPLLKMLTKERVEGAEQDFNALYGRGGAVSANFIYAAEGASETVRDAVFKITPGQIFSCYAITTKEVAAARTQRGAFMPVAGAKMFTAMEAFRKTIAASLYGMGYGELAYVTTPAVTAGAYTSPTDPNTMKFFSETGGVATAVQPGSTTAGVNGEVLLPLDAVMKIDVNSRLKLKDSISANESPDNGGWITVTRIGQTRKVNGEYCNLITFRVDANNGSLATADDKEYVLALRGGTSTGVSGVAEEDPWFPVGLSAWIPYVGLRGEATVGNETAWKNYINSSFMGVVRGVSVERLAGQFAVEESDTSKTKTPIADTILSLMDMCRTAGSTADIIVMNNKDYQMLAKELSPYQTGVYYADVKSKGKNNPTIGMSGVQAGFSTSWLDKVIDDPYCPRGVFYILDSELTKLWTYLNVEDKMQNDGVPGNEPGKPDVMSEQSDTTPEKPYQLLIDDLMTIDPGKDTTDGAAARVTINFFGSFVLLDPAVCGAGLLYNREAGKYFEPIGSKLYKVS